MAKSYQELRSSIATFDVLLFSGQGLISEAIKLLTGSQWSHVALALRMDDYDQVLCYESTTLSKIPDLVTQSPVKGVQLVPLSMRLKTYEGEVGWRRIRGPRHEWHKRAAAQFVREYAGRPYEENQLELLASALDATGLLTNQPDASSVFCSELAAMMLKKMEILPGVVGAPVAGEKPANEYTPADFAGPMELREGYRWGTVEIIETRR